MDQIKLNPRRTPHSLTMTDSISDSPAPEVSRWLRRSIGALALMGAMPFAALFGFVAVKLNSTVLSAPAFVLGALFVLGLITVFLFSVGWRLLLDRPNKYNSLLQPAAWWLIAILLMVTGAWLEWMLLVEKRYQDLHAPVFLIIFGLASAVIGMRTARGKWGPGSGVMLHAIDTTRGNFKVATWRGVPVFIHWSLPVGGLIISVFSGFRLVEWGYYCIAFFALILAHELGHFVAARAFGLKVFSVDISGFGGLCKIQPPSGIRDTLIVFSAGLLAQGLVFVSTLIWVLIFGQPVGGFGRCVVNTFTFFNAFLFVINIIPGKVPGGLSTDGRILWQLLLHATKGGPHPFPAPVIESPIFPPETRLLSMEGFTPPGFTTGVEILNDSKTPMEFVVTTLVQHLQLSREEAVALMLKIHCSGGVLVATAQEDEAETIASTIAGAARSQGYPFVCRAVDARNSQMPHALVGAT